MTFKHRCTLLLLFLVSGVASAELCSYQTYQWNVNTRSAQGIQQVVRDYDSLQSFEVDVSTGCTLCEEDQVELSIPGVPPFKLCKYLAPDVKRVLEEAISAGEPVVSVRGYRVGMTRGEVDALGNRTQFSHHSYGIALDINEAYNGLYENCVEYSGACVLRRGGAWREGHPKSLTAYSKIVIGFESIGLLWGGEILGKQKDFMHFSPTGY